MKKLLRKVLALTTLATVVPVSITHDDESGKTTYQSLLATLTVKSGEGERTDVAVEIGEGVLTGAVRNMIAAQREAAMFADEELIAAPVAPTQEPTETPAADPAE